MNRDGAGHVRLDCVVKEYGDKRVLGGLTLEIPPGKFVALVGPSGCGKTTIINQIAGYEAPDHGNITLDGELVDEPGWNRLVVFQETALFPWKTTLENVTFGPLNRGMPKDEVIDQARTLIEQFGLSGFEEKFPVQLSGGMQRRAQLARAMINSPSVMLMDEPFRGLDALTRVLMQEYLLRLFDEHPITTVFVTSEIEESIYLADRVIVLSNSPTVVKKMIDVDLPRPRDVRMLSSKRFGEIHGEILECLFEEAAKAFNTGVSGASDILEGAAGILANTRRTA